MAIGAIEAGGTKFLCGVSVDHRHVDKIVQIPTTTPDETLRQVLVFFQANPVSRLGIASFGPLDLRSASPSFGTIINTPKVDWQHVNMRRYFQENLGVRVVIDTDVDAAVLAEKAWGAAQDVDSCLYLTIGTGIGGALFAGGALLRGRSHPEWGILWSLGRKMTHSKGVALFMGTV